MDTCATTTTKTKLPTLRTRTEKHWHSNP